MTLRGGIIAGFAVAAFTAMSGVAAAEQGGAQMVLVANEFATPSYGGTSTVPRRTLEWDANKGRWGLNLGVEQHAVDSDVQWKDVSPGVYYRLTRRLHIGCLLYTSRCV